MDETPYHKTLKELTTAQKQTNKNLLKINESIKTQMSGVAKAVSEPPPTDVEGDREKKTENKKFLESLKGILKAGAGVAGGVGKAGKEGASMLGKFLKIGLAAAVVPFLGLIGGIVGVISGIMSTPEFKFFKGILSSIGKITLGFIKTMGNIGKWFLNLMPGGKLGTKLGEVFGSLGKTMSGMFKGWTGKIATFLENPKIVAVMEKVSKFIKPFTRLALWLFAGYEFIQGWGKADEIFGKEEGDASIIEKFAGGIGGMLEFLTFGLVSTEKAAKSLKATFDFFKLAVTKPKEAWKKVTDWWDKWDFNASIVEPMVKMFDDFPKKVREFIDGPLSNFGSKATTMLKDFVFGKKDPDAKEGDAKDGGLWGGIKSLFSVENVTNAIKGLAKLTVGFATMLGSLISIPFIGTSGNWTDLKSWGGLLGWIKDDLFNWENIKSAVVTVFATMKSIGSYVGDIGGNLITSLMDWIEEKFTKFNIGEKLKNAWDKAVAWMEKKLDFKMPEFKMPDWDIVGKMKDIVKGMIEGLPDMLVPDKILKWANAKPPKKTIAEKLAETHPGKMTEDEFRHSDEYRSTLGKRKDGSYKGESGGAFDRKYKAYLNDKGSGIGGMGGIIKPLDLGQLQSDEGFKKGVYKDTEGIKTIGYGFNLERAGAKEALDAAGIKKSLGDLKSGKLQLTKEEADRLMRGEYPHFADAAKRYVGKETWNKLTLDRQKILTNMAYNMGETGLNQFNDLRTALQKGDYEQAGEEMMSSKWAGQVKGRADRLTARMKNTSGNQLAASATEQGNLQARVNGGAGNTTIIKGGDTNSSSDYHIPKDPRNDNVGKSHVEENR